MHILTLKITKCLLQKFIVNCKYYAYNHERSPLKRFMTTTINCMCLWLAFKSIIHVLDVMLLAFTLSTILISCGGLVLIM